MTQEAANTSESATYEQMLVKVETIVKELDDPQLDLDTMVDRVEHGFKLIQSMRNRLEKTQERIENLRMEFIQSEKK
jgi:exodeoxyribonuclease VII small subunit